MYMNKIYENVLFKKIFEEGQDYLGRLLLNKILSSTLIPY